MVVRKAVPDDYGEVARLLTASYDEHMSGFDWYENYRAYLWDTAARAENGLVLVADEDGKLVGTLTLNIDRDRRGEARPTDAAAMVGMLAVGADMQGRGVGRALMDAAVIECVAAGRDAVELHTMATMHTAQRLYERMGFYRIADDDVLDADGNVELIAYRLDLGEIETGQSSVSDL